MCSYCGCDSIEVIGRFMAEHVEIINANGELRDAVHSGDPDALEAARSAVAGLLWPHTVAEETGENDTLIWPHRDGLIWPRPRHSGAVVTV